jgi:small nuclear ribonucleoprotein E
MSLNCKHKCMYTRKFSHRWHCLFHFVCFWFILLWHIFFICSNLYCPLSLSHNNKQTKTTQKKTRVRLWLYEDTKTQLEGQIIGFDEYMNMVLDEAVEIGKKRVEVGRILVKGDSITLIQEAQPQQKPRPPPEETATGGGGEEEDAPAAST